MIKRIVAAICWLAVIVVALVGIFTTETWAAPKAAESLKQCHTRCQEERRVCRRYTFMPEECVPPHSECVKKCDE